MTQLPLNFASADTRKRAGGQLARKMIAYLNASSGWTTRAEFKTNIGLTDRECRLGRKASHGRIIFGQRGYHLRKFATEEEISRCLATIISQIQELQDDYKWTARKSHNAIHGKTD